MFDPAQVDALLADAEASGMSIDGPDGLLASMTKAVLERALDVEMADHLGYDAGDPAGHGSGNSRNGHNRKTVLTTAGPVGLEVPRDRAGTFVPALVPKGVRRLGNVEDMILSLYARGMSTRDISAHLGETYGASISAATISRITDVVADEIAVWQARQVDAVYPILYIDAIRIKVRDAGVVANKAAHLVVVDVDGSNTCWACGFSKPKARSFGPRSSQADTPRCGTGGLRHDAECRQTKQIGRPVGPASTPCRTPSR
jgi:transposase-like protein